MMRIDYNGIENLQKSVTSSIAVYHKLENCLLDQVTSFSSLLILISSHFPSIRSRPSIFPFFFFSLLLSLFFPCSFTVLLLFFSFVFSRVSPPVTCRAQYYLQKTRPIFYSSHTVLRVQLVVYLVKD